MKAAEARRLEEEQRFREAALAEERKHVAEAKNTEEAQRLDKEMVARNEELRKACARRRVGLLSVITRTKRADRVRCWWRSETRSNGGSCALTTGVKGRACVCSVWSTELRNGS